MTWKKDFRIQLVFSEKFKVLNTDVVEMNTGDTS